MRDATLLPDLITTSAERSPEALALTYAKATIQYNELQKAVSMFAGGLVGLGLQRGERVAIYLEKRFETVIASFGAPAAGGVFVPLNPLLKPEQVGYILRDCNVRVLVTSPERLALLRDTLPLPRPAPCRPSRFARPLASYRRAECCRWSESARDAAQVRASRHRH